MKPHMSKNVEDVLSGKRGSEVREEFLRSVRDLVFEQRYRAALDEQRRRLEIIQRVDKENL